MALTVMTWNVENLFVPDGQPPAEQDQFQAKLDLLAETIEVIHPDVLALQELGPGALLVMQNRLGAANYPAMHESVPDRRGIRVGVLSKRPFQDQPQDFVDFTGQPPIDRVQGVNDAGNVVEILAMGRGAAHVQIVEGNVTVHVITCHLKSKLLVFPGGAFSTQDEDLRARVAAVALFRRSVEAAQLRLESNRIMQQNADDAVIVLGDLNDSPRAATSQMLLGPPGSEIGTLGFSRPDQGDAMRLFNTAPLIAEERRFSRRHRGVGELLDQILASEEMFPRDNGHRRLPTVDSHVDFADGLTSIGNNPNARAPEIAPDHAPVTATFDLS